MQERIKFVKGRTMLKVNGVFADAEIFTDDIEQYTLAQIQMICDNETAEGSRIRVMPDVHPGKVGPVGLTMTVGDKIIPNLVGVDIGCGMTCARIREKRVEFQKLDRVIRENIPAGMQIKKNAENFSERFDLLRLKCLDHINISRAYLSLGTLGGGNHFIELDCDEEENLYVVIHSGSRHLGVEVAEYYQNQGWLKCKDSIKAGQPMAYVEGELKEDYLSDLKVVQDFAAFNRECILDVLCKGMKWKIEDCFSVPHNYVEQLEDGVYLLRKGAAPARKGEHLVIPINMRDGVLLCTGRGNDEWNQSAPHGAGRILRRDEVKKHYTVSAFRKEMKGVYTSCIGEDTLDESPFAYRKAEDILSAVQETVQVEKILKPVYNFKGGGPKCGNKGGR